MVSSLLKEKKYKKEKQGKFYIKQFRLKSQEVDLKSKDNIYTYSNAYIGQHQLLWFSL